MSYRYFTDQLDSLMEDIRKRNHESPLRGARTIEAGGYTTREQMYELLADLADYAQSRNDRVLANKMREIRAELYPESYGEATPDMLTLERQLVRINRFLLAAGAKQSSESFSEGESDSGNGYRKTIDPHELTNEIFVVHGHDNAALHELVRLLEKLQLVPIVLREKPNSGRTLIEKFEHHANVGFSIILMTADDRGAAQRDADENRSRPRARQNVIMEMGYFIGKLGRSRVCVLKADGVEEPSDIFGVVYTDLDRAGAWKLEVASELRAAGYSIDMNRLR